MPEPEIMISAKDASIKIKKTISELQVMAIRDKLINCGFDIDGKLYFSKEWVDKND